MERKEFLNRDDVFETFFNLYKDVIEDYGMDFGTWESETEEYAIFQTETTLENMRSYVHKSNTRMDGNFANIREDWNDIPDFVESEVRPWGRFDDVIKSIDDGTISDEDLAKFQTWALDWFFTAFGTFGLKYNFGEWISELEYEREQEEKDAA